MKFGLAVPELVEFLMIEFQWPRASFLHKFSTIEKSFSKPQKNSSLNLLYEICVGNLLYIHSKTPLWSVILLSFVTLCSPIETIPHEKHPMHNYQITSKLVYKLKLKANFSASAFRKWKYSVITKPIKFNLISLSLACMNNMNFYWGLFSVF